MSRGFLLAALTIMLLSGCKKEEEAQPEAQPAPAAVQEKDTEDAKKNAEEETKDAPDGGVKKSDAGVEDIYRDQLILTEETPVNEIVELVKHLQVRIQEIDLREREVIQREQLVAALEDATMKQVEVLWKLKSQVKTLLEKVEEDFRDERKAYEIKLKKEKELKATMEKEAAIDREKRADELKRVAEEMTEARERRIVQLAATIKGMRAAAGAGMLASMEEKDAVAVLRQLGSRQAAALLGNMPAEKAARLAESMLGPKPISPELIDAEGDSSSEADKNNE